jgi:mycothiol system anti-sigma-R factor
MLCDDVKRVVYFFLDGTLAERKQQDFNSHISTCPDCEARMRVHGRLRKFIARRLTPAPAPQRLKMRLSRSLRAFRDEWSRELT